MYIKTFIIIIILLFTLGCSNWTVNGVRVDKNINLKSSGKLLTGVGAAFLAHWAGHIAYYELTGLNWEQDGLREIIYGPISDSSMAWAGRTGFIGQLFIGSILKYGPWSEEFEQGFFTTGYHIGTAVEIISYPVRSYDGDLKLIQKNSNSLVEWGGYSLWSLMLLNPDREKGEIK